MARKVSEWTGKTDDAKVPPRVRVRIFQREKGICHLSDRKIAPGEPWDLDHKVALINGGRHAESNLFPALRDKHKEKTKADVAEKSRVADRAKSNIGAKAAPSKPIQSPGFRPTEKTLKREARPKYEPRIPRQLYRNV